MAVSDLDHMRAMLEKSDELLHEKVDSLKGLGLMKAEFFMSELRRHQEWREATNTRLDNIESAGRTRAALLATGLVVLGLAIGVINWIQGF